MEVIQARNVHTAIPLALDRLNQKGVMRESRNGRVRLFPTPVTTVYERPRERVVFWAQRDANPFFHLMESLWMLAGGQDVDFPAQFVRQMREYSDDGKTFNAAYGYRWRRHFLDAQGQPIDQLAKIVEALHKNKDDRRAVLQIWDPARDLGTPTRDAACNTVVSFHVNHEGRLDMTVFNRSNDIVWGAYGANAVHFSMLQEYIASGIGVLVGTYYQVSTNFHAYDSSIGQVEGLERLAEHRIHGQSIPDPYVDGQVATYPIMSTPIKDWTLDLAVFMEKGPIPGLRDPFFTQVVTPMYCAHLAFRKGSGLEKYDVPLEILEQCKASDWRLAATEWIHRRRQKFLDKESV